MNNVARIVKLETGFVSYAKYPAYSAISPAQKVMVGVWLEKLGRRYPAVIRWTQPIAEIGCWPEPMVTVFSGYVCYSGVDRLLSVADMAALMTALPRLPVIDYIRHDQLNDWLVNAAGGM